MGMYGYRDRPSGPPRVGWPPVSDPSTAHTAHVDDSSPAPGSSAEAFASGGWVYVGIAAVVVLAFGLWMWLELTGVKS